MLLVFGGWSALAAKEEKQGDGAEKGEEEGGNHFAPSFRW